MLPAPPRAGQALRDVFTSRSAWSGFFLHYLTLASVNSFLFLWGVPYMTRGHGLAPAEMGVLLTVNVIVMVAIGPVIGLLTGRFPAHRTRLGAIAGTVLVIAWTLTLAVPVPLTAWQLRPLIVALTVGSATCSVGFDLARTGVPPRAMGTATGIVNLGGYSRSLVSVLVVVLLLDILAPDGNAGLDDFRIVLASMGVPMAPSAVGLWITSRKL